MTEVHGGPVDTGRRFAVVAAEFNEVVVGKLVEGALASFRSHGVDVEDVRVVWVPGAFELPLAAAALAGSGRYDAVVCLGAVIRGETAHFDFVAGEAARGIQDVALRTGVPVLLGVLTAETMAQALDRAGGDHGNKGWDAAAAAVRMADVMDQVGEGPDRKA